MTHAIDIFVIDDDRDLLRELRDIFHSNNYRVETFTDGDTALKRMQEDIPDIVLLDLKMRGKSGFQVAREMERLDAVRDVPIIAISAFYECDESTPMMKVSGFRGLLTKPLGPRELLNTVKKVLNARTPDKGGLR